MLGQPTTSHQHRETAALGGAQPRDWPGLSNHGTIEEREKDSNEKSFLLLLASQGTLFLELN